MEKIATNLYLHQLPRGKWTNFSWLIKRKAGNYLIACADVTDALGEIEKLGGVKRVFLTDIHFANAWHGKVANHFGAALVCHESDAAKVKKRCKATKNESLGMRNQVDDDFHSMHTPGHAEGGLCYLWEPDGEGTLFTGDFLCATTGGWAVFCGQAKKKTMSQSLKAVAGLPVARLCPGVSEGKPLPMKEFAPRGFSKLVDDTIAKFCAP
ncbi:MAG: hypothetical protein IT462_03165 [Planctomycetes bacterium]|nr:hypothetical protein [Planctomycetota bacterium]